MTELEQALDKAALDLATKDADAIFIELRTILGKRDLVYALEGDRQANQHLLSDIYSNCKGALHRRYSRKLAKGILDAAQTILKEKTQ